MRRILLSLCVFTILTGCNQDKTIEKSKSPQEPIALIDQGSICETTKWTRDATSACKVGQKILFAPNSWGNAQLPILFASVNCDHRYNIALTEGAVSCIYLPTK